MPKGILNMNDLLKVMEQGLTESDTRLLKSIYEPTVVGIPAEDARRSLVVMPDGELRCYGRTNKKSVYGGGIIINNNYVEEDLEDLLIKLNEYNYYFRTNK